MQSTNSFRVWVCIFKQDFFSLQLLFQKSKGTVQLAVELLDTDEENSDGPVDTEVHAWDLAKGFSV